MFSILNKSGQTKISAIPRKQSPTKCSIKLHAVFNEKFHGKHLFAAGKLLNNVLSQVDLVKKMGLYTRRITLENIPKLFCLLKYTNNICDWRSLFLIKKLMH